MDNAAEIAARFLGKDNREELERAILLYMDRIIEAEREACAKIADELTTSPDDREAGAAGSIAEAIRKRNQW